MKAKDGNLQSYGIWSVDSASGVIQAHDALARDWSDIVESPCATAALSALLLPTPTFTPQPTSTNIPTPTPVLRTTGDAISTLWSYLVRCFTTLGTGDLESALDPSTKDYVVKDKGAINYGVWRVSASSGDIRPDNERARSRDATVRAGLC